jgi:uncharacterized membrane protein
MSVSAKDFFSASEQNEIKMAIQNAELDTSGEIRVHVENLCKGDVLDRAAYIFKQLGMEKTELRNGVLIYLAIKDRKFAIIGDMGINSVVPPSFWDDIKQEMLISFQKNEFCNGLCSAVEAVGEHLKKYFPHKKDDVNELRDDISFGDDRK